MELASIAAHRAATAIRAQYGLEAREAVLGHAKADVTQLYAERDLSRARDVMRAIGWFCMQPQRVPVRRYNQRSPGRRE